MKRREFIVLVAGAVTVWPSAARAQQSATPIIGWLESGSSQNTKEYGPPFGQGLAENGYVEGRNVAIEYRWANNQYDRLPALADELVQRRIAVIYASNTTNAARAAMSATSKIPIVFANAGDPVRLGIVASLNRPGGNVTGVSYNGGVLVTKRLELLRELLPEVTAIGFLTNPNNPISENNTADVKVAADHINQKIVVLKASTDDQLDAAFASVERGVGAMLVDVDQLYNARRDRIVALAAQYRIPTSYGGRAPVDAGGLMSYSDDRLETIRQAGNYVGRILRGEKPADLPVLLPSKFDFAINLKAAKALGITFPPSFYLRADEVIE
jgi:putative ABC transport system substrate-binding protein